MKRFFTLEYWTDEGWFVGKLREVPGVFSQGETLEELKEKRAALKDHMEKLEASSKKTWEAAKEKMNEAMDDLEKTYNKVRADFK